MIGLLALVLALAATPAAAHGALAGAGGFYAGMLHPVLAWEHLLLLLALGGLLGRRPRMPAAAPLTALAAALATGLALGTAGIAWAAAPFGILAAAAVAGAALAAGLPARGPAAAILATACGLAIGIDTGVPGGAAWLAHAGVLTGVLLIALNAMALTSAAARPPYAVAVRVAGSWITAAAVMVLALHLRGAAAT
jgi:hydrogenase/urease accessory protein HupE